MSCVNTNKKFAPITWLGQQDRFGLQFIEGWVFLRVLSNTFTQFSPYVDEAKFFLEKSPGETQSTHVVMKDSNSDELLQVLHEDAHDTVNQVGISWHPVTDKIRLYTNWPTGTQLGRIPGSTLNITVGGDVGYKTPIDSPRGFPTEAFEFIIPHGYDVEFAFSNEEPTGGRDLLPVPHIDYNVLTVEPLKPMENKKLIAAMANGAIPFKRHTIGAWNDPAPYASHLKHSWGIDPIKMKDARKLGGI